MNQKLMPQSRHSEIIVQELNGETIIYDLRTNKALCLNETSTLVWQLCDGKTNIAEISRRVGKQLNAAANQDLIWLALDQLKQENLLSGEEKNVSQFDAVSRREAIRRVGLGTMIALPFITSLVAPPAINAQSGVCGGSCNCSKPNTTSQLPALCEATLGGNSNCPKRTLCDCLVVAGIGSKGGTCQGS